MKNLNEVVAFNFAFFVFSYLGKDILIAVLQPAFRHNYNNAYFKATMPIELQKSNIYYVAYSVLLLR